MEISTTLDASAHIGALSPDLNWFGLLQRILHGKNSRHLECQVIRNCFVVRTSNYTYYDIVYGALVNYLMSNNHFSFECAANSFNYRFGIAGWNLVAGNAIDDFNTLSSPVGLDPYLYVPILPSAI